MSAIRKSSVQRSDTLRFKSMKFLSPEEEKQRKILAKCRFKAIVHKVIANLYWLSDSLEEDDLGQNMTFLTSKKEKIESPLSIEDKFLLLSRLDDRTPQDIEEIFKILDRIPCFKKYPPNVKEDLGSVTNFMYLPQDREIIKQDGKATALYFSVAGDVKITQKQFDPILSEWSSVELAVLGPGTMFGEVALLFDIPRTATVTTITPCELIYITRNNFMRVLKASIWKQFETALDCLNSVTYFKNFSPEIRREFCIISREQTFKKNDLIFGGEFGWLNYGYFVMSGTCCMVEHLRLEVSSFKGKKKYKLYNADVSPEEARIALELFKKTQRNSQEIRSSVISGRRSSYVINGIKITEGAQNISSTVDEEIIESRIRKSASPACPNTLLIERIKHPPGLEDHFVQVCEFKEKSFFNIGENVKRRYILAKTDCRCMVVPRYWLLANSHANIWQRVKNYLNLHIPNTEGLFKSLMEDIKWSQHKTRMFDKILKEKLKPSDNTIHDVPYNIRIK